MGINLSFYDVISIGDGIYQTPASQSDIDFLLKQASSKGMGPSLVILKQVPEYDGEVQTISFPADAVVPVYRGTEKRLLMISSSQNSSYAEADDMGEDGDNAFIQGLPRELSVLGKAILARIRSHAVGHLVYHSSSKKYVETPNYWVIKIQPRDLSLRITVYGEPDSFSVPNKSISLKADMGSYSAFKVEKIEQVDDAVSVILQAKEKKSKRNPN